MLAPREEVVRVAGFIVRLDMMCPYVQMQTEKYAMAWETCKWQAWWKDL